MAPKNAEVIENPPMDSSSEEEESGSSGEESESSAEETKKDESNVESDSESESESGSDSEPAKKNKQPVATSGSAVTLPESSKAKRPLQQAESEGKKKLKISATEDVKKAKTDNEVKKISGEDAKKMFQRLFSETDEIALLQGILDFTSKGKDPYEDSDAFCNYVKKLIDFNANKSQIVTKLQRLKKKFVNTVKKSLKKGKNEDEIVFSKDLEQKAFELSRKIWGENGVFASKSRKKLGGTVKEMKPGGTPMKETKLKPHSSPKKQQDEMEKPKAKVVNTGLSIAREIASFFCAENSSVCGLDETTITALIEKFPEGAEKRELEGKWKKVKAKQVELCLQRTELVNETAKMIFKAYES